MIPYLLEENNWTTDFEAEARNQCQEESTQHFSKDENDKTQNSASSKNIIPHERDAKTLSGERKPGNWSTNFPKEDGWRKFSKQKGNDKRRNSRISACCQAGDFCRH